MTRVGKAEADSKGIIQQRDACALIDQLEDYRRHWPEMAKEFELLHAGELAAARKLIGGQNHGQ